MDNKQRVFYINDRFSFGALKSIIYYEFPNKSVHLDFHQTGLTIDSNVNAFLYDGVSPGKVTLQVDQSTYLLKNNLAFSDNPMVNRLLNKQAKSKRMG